MKRIVALSLAEETAAALGAAGEEREEFITAAMVVGEWLAVEGRPGRWDTLRPAALVESMGFASPHEADGFLLALIALLGHGGLNEKLPIPATRRMMLEIQKLAKSPIISGLAAETAAQLQRCLD